MASPALQGQGDRERVFWWGSDKLFGMDRREFLKTAGGVVLLAGARPWPEVLGASTQSMGASTRGGGFNVLFMTADDMNGSMPGWMGNSLKLTPNMDAFADGAHRFVKNHDAAPICQPSREAMLTGLWPHRSGGLGFNPIREGVPTLATVLKGAGYFVAAFNKLEHMQPRSCFPWEYSSNDSGRNPPLIEEEVGKAIAMAKGRPFFINCNMRDPHRPWPGMRGDQSSGGEGLAIDDVVKKVKAEQVVVPSFLEDLPGVKEDLAHYCNAVQRLDISFGKAMAALQASGEMDRTVVVFVSDHGMPFPLSKATCYHNGSWCPVLIGWPGMGKGQRFEQMTQSIDIMPTLLDVLGIGKPEMDGRSWLPLVKGEVQEGRDYIINNVNGVASGAHYPMRAVQTERSALVVTPWSNGKNRLRGIDSMTGRSFRAMERAADSDPKIKKRVEQYTVGYSMAFYDLVVDPDQRENQIGNPVHREEIKRLQDILMGYMVRTADPELEHFRTILAGGVCEVETGKGRAGE